MKKIHWMRIWLWPNRHPAQLVGVFLVAYSALLLAAFLTAK